MLVSGMLLIGEVAAQTSASTKAIRHYETLGLLGRVNRRGAYRVYRPEQVQTVRLIREAQAVGITLAQLAMLEREDETRPDWAAVLPLLEQRREQIRASVEHLHTQLRALNTCEEELRVSLAAATDCDTTAAPA